MLFFKYYIILYFTNTSKFNKYILYFIKINYYLNSSIGFLKIENSNFILNVSNIT